MALSAGLHCLSFWQCGSYCYADACSVRVFAFRVLVSKFKMISFSSLGSFGRLGNQLFQYAFLRSTALRLGVRFYCPNWIGDEIFDLNDRCLRETKSYNSDFLLTVEDERRQGYSGLVPLEDGRDYRGYFASYRYFDGFDVREWYSFKSIPSSKCASYLQQIRGENSIGLHCRFGDFRYLPAFYNPYSTYYERAVKSIDESRTSVFVFSDDHASARRLLGDLKQCTYVEGCTVAEDLLLMSHCKHFVCSASTLSWWGAYLRPPESGRTFRPLQGFSRPGSPWRCEYAFPPDWKAIDAGLGLMDHYLMRKSWLMGRQKLANWSGPVRKFIGGKRRT